MRWAKKIMGCVSEYIDQRGKSMAHNFGWNDPRGLYNVERDEYTPMPLAQQNAVSQMQRAQLQHQYAMAQQQAMMNNAAAQMSGLSGLAQGGYAAQQAVSVKKTFATIHGGLTVPTFEELDDPDSAFNLPLDALATMWGARFGYRWVKDEDTAAAMEENENLWIITLKRLSDAGCIEVQQFRHPAQLGYDTAWKLKEDDGNR